MNPIKNAPGILLFIAATIFAQNTVTLNIAVNDLTGKGIEQSSAAIISDRLRSELISTGVFRVMERNEMDNILKEQGFQKTGACDDASCLVEVGQLLGVERVVAGSVGKIGDIYTISLRMINVATGQILFTVDEDYEGEIKGLLSVAVGNAAKKLALGAGSEITKAAMSGKTGDLYISSEPSGASVEIDGNAVAGLTPMTLQKIPAGERRIVVRKGEYYGSKTETLQPDDLLKVSIVMARGKGSLKVFTNPDGAAVLVDGERKGTTPCKIDNLPAGEHILALEKEGYLPHSETVVIRINEINNLTIKLNPLGYVSVSADNAAARIMVNGKEAGLGSILKYAVPADSVKLSVESPGFELWTKTMNLAQGAHESITVKLVSVFGKLEVTSTPQGAQVYLNEEKTGSTPYSNASLKPGNYMLKVTIDTYNPVKEDITIVKNTIVKKDFTLEHTTDYLDSKKKEKAAAKKRSQWARRISFGIGAAAAGGIGLYFNTKTSDAYEKYKAETTDDASVHDKNWKAYEDKARVRNILYTAAGVLCAGFVISIPF